MFIPGPLYSGKRTYAQKFGGRQIYEVQTRAADAAGCAGDERDFFLHMQNLRGFPYCLSA